MDVWEIKHQDFFLAKSSQDRIAFLLRYAILAPSTHNTQPWEFEVQRDCCRILLMTSKKLPIGDPKTRDLYISLGCCLENLIAAAKAFGVNAKVDLSELRDDSIRVSFQDVMSTSRIVDPDSLKAITDRFNARGIFKQIPLDKGLADQIVKLSSKEVETSLIDDKAAIRDIADLTAKGLEMAYADPAFRKEISSWIRPNFSKKRDGIPGYALRLSTPMSAIMPLMMRNFNIGKKLGQLNRGSLLSAPAVCVLSTPKEDAETWVKVGRTAEHIMLLFNRNGMKTSIFVASIEMGNLTKQLQSIVGTKYKPQFLFCGGYIDTPQGHTRRYPLNDSIKVKI